MSIGGLLMAQQSTGGFGVANVTPVTPESRIHNLPGYADADIKDPPDTLPSEKQPPGVDEDEDEPQSLEEALMM